MLIYDFTFDVKIIVLLVLDRIVRDSFGVESRHSVVIHFANQRTALSATCFGNISSEQLFGELQPSGCENTNG